MQSTLFNVVRKKGEDEQILTPTQGDFLYYIKAMHTGRGSAITSKDLRRFGPGPTIRGIVHELRIKGYPICSESCGYFYAETPEELHSTIKSMESRSKEISEVAEALDKVLTKMLF